MMMALLLIGSICCTFFSLFAIIFLAGISAALRTDSVYILIKAPNGKPKLAESVDGAVAIYVATMVISILFWVRTYTQPTRFVKK